MVFRRGDHLKGTSCIYGRNWTPVKPSTLLSWIWLFGLLLGFAVAFVSRDNITPLLSKVVPVIVSVPVKLLILSLPFLLSAFAVSIDRYGWLLLICGVKAFCFSFSCFLICLCYGQAGWLACGLFLFGELSSLPCLFFYWLRHLSIKGGDPMHIRVIIFILVAVFVIIDYRILSPYAEKFGFF
jgi:hypothetical protein